MAQILLVDDDEDLAETLADLFTMLDHQVDVVNDGAGAIAKMQGRHYDLILLDWQLPDMTGVDVCKQFRESGGKAKVLMLTGMRDSASKEAGKAAGADDFVTKPFTVDQITERLQAMLG